MRLKRMLAVALAAGAMASTPNVVHADAGVHRIAAACSAGFKQATIGGEKKCLRRGQFCARRYDSQYRRYGYRCVKRDARGNYHLT